MNENARCIVISSSTITNYYYAAASLRDISSSWRVLGDVKRKKSRISRDDIIKEKKSEGREEKKCNLSFRDNRGGGRVRKFYIHSRTKANSFFIIRRRKRYFFPSSFFLRRFCNIIDGRGRK